MNDRFSRPVRRGARGAGAVLALLLAAGCGGGPSGGPHAAARKPPAAAGLATPGSVVLLQCGGPGHDGRLTTTAMSLADGHRVASVVTQLPHGASPSHLCGDTDDASGSATTYTELYDSGYHHIAGRTPGPHGQGMTATAFDLATGRPAGPGPDSDAYASVPDDSPPVLQGGQLWYVDSAKRLRSRRPGQAPGAAADHGEAGGDQVVMAGDVPWYGHHLVRSVPAPSGTYAAEYDGSYEQTALRRAGHVVTDTTPLSEGSSAGAPAPAGGAHVPPCAPDFWLDAHTLVCSADTQVYRLTLSDDLRSVTAQQALLPATGRGVEGVLLAPDHRSFVFLSGEVAPYTLYRQSFGHPGAAPQPIGTVPAAEHTYLVGWN